MLRPQASDTLGFRPACRRQVEDCRRPADDIERDSRPNSWLRRSRQSSVACPQRAWLAPNRP